MSPVSPASSQTFGSTSSSLIEGVKAHDPQAWVRFSRLYGPEVYRWARKSGLQESDAADVVQEVFRAVDRRMEDFHRDHPGDSFRGWLWTIARNKLHDHFRRCTREQAEGGESQERLLQVPEPPCDDTTSAAEGYRARLTRRALEVIRAEFETQTWQIFWRTTVEGHAAADLADELGMTKSAVRQSKYRVLRRLRQELEGLLDH